MDKFISSINTVFQTDGRVTAAWLFGSYARGEENIDSDVDIMIEFSNSKKYSMFDLMDLAFILEKKINKKVDLVEKGCVKNFAVQFVNHDLIKIYG